MTIKGPLQLKLFYDSTKLEKKRKILHLWDCGTAVVDSQLWCNSHGGAVNSAGANPQHTSYQQL